MLLPFRLHHVNPDDFLRRSFLDTNGDAAAGMVPILALLLWMPLDTTQWQAAGPFLFALCAFGGLTNQIPVGTRAVGAAACPPMPAV